MLVTSTPCSDSQRQQEGEVARTLPYWLGEQETDSSCGGASLKYALCWLGYPRQESHVRKLARVTWWGTDRKNIPRVARTIGAIAEQRDFGRHEFEAAHLWLTRHLEKRHPVVIDVDDGSHYVCCVQNLDGRVVVIDPGGYEMDETWNDEYADVLMLSPSALKKRWAYKGSSGLGFSGHAIMGQGRGHSPRFTEKAIKRYQSGCAWVLDEYLLDCVEIADRAKRVKGPTVSLATMLGELGDDCVVAMAAHWNGAGGGDVQVLQAHVRDLQLAAEAMDLKVPEGARTQVAVEMTAILMEMLNSED